MEIVLYMQNEDYRANKKARNDPIPSILKVKGRSVCSPQGDAAKRLEALGQRVGERLVERAARDTPRFKNELDAVVFMCKQFWMLAFNKQVDNLKTNHQVCACVPSTVLP